MHLQKVIHEFNAVVAGGSVVTTFGAKADCTSYLIGLGSAEETVNVDLLRFDNWGQRPDRTGSRCNQSSFSLLKIAAVKDASEEPS